MDSSQILTVWTLFVEKALGKEVDVYHPTKISRSESASLGFSHVDAKCNHAVFGVTNLSFDDCLKMHLIVEI